MDSPVSRALPGASSTIQVGARLQLGTSVGDSRLRSSAICRIRLLVLMAMLPLIGLLGCASSLVDADKLEDTPKEYDQKITELKTDAPLTSMQATTTTNFSSASPTRFATGIIAATPVVKSPAPLKKGVWQPAAWPYGIGEVAEYTLRYGLIEGGVVTMTTMPLKMMDGEKVLHYSGHVFSTRLLELFYKVDNRIDSWVSMETHLPLRQEILQRESEQWGSRVVTFDSKKQTAKFYATTEKKNKKKKVEKFDSKLDHYAQDIFSALYFFRFIEPLDRVNFSIHDRGKNWNNETIYLGTEVLDLPVGPTRARRYKLQPRISGHLKPKGDVEGWFSDDDRRIMVRFRANLKFGSITGDLRKYIPGKRLATGTPRMVTPIDLDSMGNASKNKKK